VTLENNGERVSRIVRELFIQMLNTLLGKQKGLGIGLKWASRILVSLVRVITNLPFSCLWVATSRDSDNFSRDFIL